jgi:aminopeptidase N
MKWDEDTFDLEYDLDLYMIVAVGDFNMGAMENKGLNIFNSKYVLASPETATDDDYENIQGVIGHEYFHNWTGNRVTCRDWFQLTLKEGLTVYRDQRFSEDMTSAAVKRIRDVNVLRTMQFAEDAGPMAHPIRPESYVEMNNFYTVTVYNKGAEIVRMYERLFGRDGFRKGLDLYFDRHDGQAVTCDDFRRAMAEANGARLDRFERWYSQAGTPRVKARGAYDPVARTYALTLEQSCPSVNGAHEPKPFHLPVEVGLLGADGRDMQVTQEGQSGSRSSHLLELTDQEQTFTFTGVREAPVPSILRGFTAPVRLAAERGRDELGFLLANDADPFNRWDAGQELARGLLLEIINGGERRVDPLFVEAFGKVLTDDGLDGSLKALALALPSERLLAQEMEVIDVDAIHDARRFVARELAGAWRSELEHKVASSEADGPYRSDKRSIDRRRIRNRALAYLACLEEPEISARIGQAFERADNMTDRQAALAILSDVACPEREAALAAFHAQWKDDPLVLDKWFVVQAGSSLPNALDSVKALAEHPDFTHKNPNRVYALLVTFGKANQVRFHDATGEGYVFLADQVLAIDALNPQVASRLVSSFNPWRRFDASRRELLQAQLERMAAHAELSKDVREIVERALA